VPWPGARRAAGGRASPPAAASAAGSPRPAAGGPHRREKRVISDAFPGRREQAPRNVRGTVCWLEVPMNVQNEINKIFIFNTTACKYFENVILSPKKLGTSSLNELRINTRNTHPQTHNGREEGDKAE